MPPTPAGLARMRGRARLFMNTPCVIRRPTEATADSVSAQPVAETTVCLIDEPRFNLADAGLDAAAQIPGADDVPIYFPYGTGILAGDNVVAAGHVYAVRRVLDDLTSAIEMTALTTRKS